MGWIATSESEFWWGSKTCKVTSHIIYNSLGQKVLFATKEDMIKRTASDDHFWMCGEVLARAAGMGREPLRSLRYHLRLIGGDCSIVCIFLTGFKNRMKISQQRIN